MRNLFGIFILTALLAPTVNAQMLGGGLQGLGQGMQGWAMMEAQREAQEEAYNRQLQIEKLRYLQALEARKRAEILRAQRAQNGK